MVMRGYFDMPQASAEVIDRQGWLHTGDLATYDQNGVWRIVGRIKDLIIRGGENIDPAAIEAAGRRHPAVADMHVVGVPSEYYGEEIFAWVRLAAGEQIDEQQLRSHLEQHLGRFEVPRYIRFVDSFPMTESGKVQKNRLREDARHALATMSAAGGPINAPVIAPVIAPGVAPVVAWTASDGRPPLPLLPPKNATQAIVEAASAAPAGGPDSDPASTERHGPVPGPRSANLPPRSGWHRPDGPGWRWRPRKELTDMSETDRPSTAGEAPASSVDLDEVRQRGQRIKTWGIVGDIREQIEATGEEPIMYKALGTPSQTQHPFNLFGDIRSQPSALARDVPARRRDRAGRAHAQRA